MPNATDYVVQLSPDDRPAGPVAAKMSQQPAVNNGGRNLLVEGTMMATTSFLALFWLHGNKARPPEVQVKL